MSTSTVARPSVTDAESGDIAATAYLYFYPLILMELTRLQATNIEAGKEIGKGPMNAFHHVPAYPPADFKVVVRTNFDTLYSSGWVDLTHEPVVVSVPDTSGRYYLLPMLDMWTDVFASPGWRTTGTQAENFVVVPPGWTGSLPPDLTRIDAPTPIVWIIGRTKTDGPADYDAVHQIQSGYKLTPLSQWGKTPTPPVAKIDPSVDMKTPPKTQIDTMPGDKYFALAAELLKVYPPHITDQPMIAQLKKVGFEPGKSLQFSNLPPSVQQAMKQASSQAQQLMLAAMPRMASIINGWLMNISTMGVYGDYYLKRAIVAQQGLGANVPEDAIYPMNLADADGKPLNGANRYTLHFDAASMPPVQAFWSVTLYDSDGFQVPNALNRFALSSWMPLKKNADGSIDLYFQHESPGKDLESNWLPAPSGDFNLCMRLYAPASAVINGEWNPPPVKRT
jgi:hypothetical protein